METRDRNSLVSIIIPAHNAVAYIHEALDSVLNQTYPDIEIIVVNDGSTDETESVVQEYVARFPNKVRLYSQKNKGQASARNVGIRNSYGAYIAFLDADDTWMSEKLEQQMRILKMSGADICYANTLFLGGERNGHAMFEYVQPYAGHVFHTLIKGNFIVNSSVVVKCEVIHAVGLLNERPMYRNIEDYDCWLRIALAGYSFSYIKTPLVQYRIHDFQHTKTRGNNWSSLARMYMRYFFNPRVWALGETKTVARMLMICFKNILGV